MAASSVTVFGCKAGLVVAYSVRNRVNTAIPYSVGGHSLPGAESNRQGRPLGCRIRRKHNDRKISRIGLRRLLNEIERVPRLVELPLVEVRPGGRAHFGQGRQPKAGIRGRPTAHQMHALDSTLVSTLHMSFDSSCTMPAMRDKKTPNAALCCNLADWSGVPSLRTPFSTAGNWFSRAVGKKAGGAVLPGTGRPGESNNSRVVFKF
jgi:hypothetical protein